jgi:arylsulfatase A-like enzyme
MAGLPLHPKEHLDGTSFLSVLKGGGLPERPLFWHYPHYSNQGGAPNGAVRLGDYKLIEWYEDMSTELFNLRNDPGEHRDLAISMPDKVTELRSLLHRWRKKVRAQMPSWNPHYDPAARRSGHQPPAAPVDA